MALTPEQAAKQMSLSDFVTWYVQSGQPMKPVDLAKRGDKPIRPVPKRGA